ncbi:MAG: hypothetical protein NW218_06460 [Saprospiraceae bacterium]|nr:hypothetical protein [Saprospiraceae bacterium]
MLSYCFRLIPMLLAGVLMFTACQSAQNLTERGDYDGAIDFCVRKLQGKKKKKTEYVKGLETAFQKAQSRDLANVDQLIAAGQPENWERIHDIHQNIRNRQNRVTPLLPLRAKDGNLAHFEMIDIATLENESRSKAAAFLYNEAKNFILLGERGDRKAARKGYYKLIDLEQKYYRSYQDKDLLKVKAKALGTAQILFKVENNSGQILPVGFVDRILNIGKNQLDSDWKSFDFDEKADQPYDFKVVFKVRNIDVSPERVHERSYTDEKEIKDGWDYVLDKKGNVVKDSLGNDLKTPRYVRIRADVLEVYQSKSTRLAGIIEIYDAQRNTLLDNRDIATEVLFENYASTFKGDNRALSEDSRCRIGNTPLPFPHNEDMLNQAAERLKPNLKNELAWNPALD